jgi:DNA-directed RNA polymerase specialized sigma24 family protein
MRFYEDRKEQEIADALDMSLSAVKKQIERGLKALRPRLSDRGVS